LGHSLDEMPPHTRRFLEQVEEMVKAACQREQVTPAEYRFTRRQIREHTALGHTQVELHLSRLVTLELVLPHRGSRGQSFVYELRYQGQGKDGRRFVPGLIDVEELRRRRGDAGTTTNLPALEGHLPGEIAHLPGSNRPQTGAKPGGCRTGGNGTGALESGGTGQNPLLGPKNAYQGGETSPSSYIPASSYIPTMARRAAGQRGPGRGD